MTDFERLLEECLEELRSGVDLDACLARHPDDATALRPHLVAAASVMQAFEARPHPEFADAARERFLIASGRRIEEAFETEPSLSFFAAARVRFLMAAQRMRLAERARPPRRVSLFRSPMRAIATTAAALVLFAGFSGYTVASADNALPGDWRYPIKLQKERVRLALAFSDDAERDVRLDIASERAEEIQTMAAKGRIIGPGVLKELQKQTEPLAQAVENGGLDTEELERVHAVTENAKVILEQAAPQVAPEAQPRLAEVRALAANTASTSLERLVNSRQGPSVLTPVVPLITEEPAETPEPDVSATATPDGSGTPPATGTPGAAPTSEPTEPARSGLSVDLTPVESVHGVTWVRLAVGSLTTLIPSQGDGWGIQGVNVNSGAAPAPALVRLSNADGTQLITINPSNGDMWWFIAVNGNFDEIQLRSTHNDGQTFVTDRELLTYLYGAFADVPLYVLDNIEIAPEPEPTPEPTSTAAQ